VGGLDDRSAVFGIGGGGGVGGVGGGGGGGDGGGSSGGVVVWNIPADDIRYNASVAAAAAAVANGIIGCSRRVSHTADAHAYIIDSDRDRNASNFKPS